MANALAIDLVEVYRLSLASDPTFLSAGAANRAAQESRPQAMAALLPNVQMGFAYDRVHADIRESATGRTGNDTFRFEGVFGDDRIVDFVKG